MHMKNTGIGQCASEGVSGGGQEHVVGGAEAEPCGCVSVGAVVEQHRSAARAAAVCVWLLTDGQLSLQLWLCHARLNSQPHCAGHPQVWHGFHR